MLVAQNRIGKRIAWAGPAVAAVGAPQTLFETTGASKSLAITAPQRPLWPIVQGVQGVQGWGRWPSSASAARVTGPELPLCKAQGRIIL